MSEQVTEETEEEVQTPAEETEEGTEEELETFPLAYVQKLRQEAAEHRTRAQRADDLGQRLHTSLVERSGRLQDASDLPYDESHLEDAEALTTAIDELLTRKPHLASRRLSGDVGQGVTGGDNSVDLAGMLRRNAS